MDLGRYKSKTVSSKDLKAPVMASSTEEDTSHLTFTFVPATGTLPSQVLLGNHEVPSTQKGQKTMLADFERNLEMKKHKPSESFSDAFCTHRSGDSFSKEEAEEIKHNDLFIAEFVVVMDSDDGEDGKISNKKDSKVYQFTRAQRSTITQPKGADVKEIDDSEAQQAFRQNLGNWEQQQHLYQPTTDMNSCRFQLTHLSHPSREMPVFKSSMNSSGIVHTFSKPLLSQESKYLNISTRNEQPQECNHLQVQRPYTSSGKCIRSNTLSPLPIKIVKHPLCRSPSPLSSQFYGSSSTICSMNDAPSPVPRPETSSRLSFLTSLLKSKTSDYDRTISPDPSQYHSRVKSNTYFQEATGTSSLPRKSQSCFALNNPQDFKISNVRRKPEIHPSDSTSDTVHNKPSFHSRSLRSLSPESILLKSSSGSFFSRKGVVSPLLELPQQPNRILNSSRENISTLNEKPPLNKQSYTPLKKYSVLGKSKRVTLFPPPLPFHQTLSNTTSQKPNVMPYVKRYGPCKDNLRSSFSLSENLGQNRARSSSPMENTRFTPSYHNTYQIFNENVDSQFDVSPSLHLSYTHHFDSSEELSTNNTPMCVSPTNILGSPMLKLSRSCEMRPPSSLSQSSDQENNQSYKVKSSYKSFAAIPTNTLLRDQKAIDKPEKNITNTSKENLDPHQEMCSPALLRQQTEEICAAIDEVLHDDPLPRRYKVVAKPLRKRDSKSATILRSPPKSAGRETRYASIQPTADTRTNTQQKTRPGVIRPISLKINTTENMDAPVSSFDYQQFPLPQYKRETYIVESTRGKDLPSGI